MCPWAASPPPGGSPHRHPARGLRYLTSDRYPLKPSSSAPLPKPNPLSPGHEEEPMQLGRAWLSPEEMEKRFRQGRCIYCSQLGHFIARCPLKGPVNERILVSQMTVKSNSSRPRPSVSLSSPFYSRSQVVLLAQHNPHID